MALPHDVRRWASVRSRASCQTWRVIVRIALALAVQEARGVSPTPSVRLIRLPALLRRRRSDRRPRLGAERRQRGLVEQASEHGETALPHQGRGGELAAVRRAGGGTRHGQGADSPGPCSSAGGSNVTATRRSATSAGSPASGSSRTPARPSGVAATRPPPSAGWMVVPNTRSNVDRGAVIEKAVPTSSPVRKPAAANPARAAAASSVDGRYSARFADEIGGASRNARPDAGRTMTSAVITASFRADPRRTR